MTSELCTELPADFDIDAAEWVRYEGSPQFDYEIDYSIAVVGGDAASLAAGVRLASGRLTEFKPRLANRDLRLALSWERQAEVLLALYSDLWKASDV